MAGEPGVRAEVILRDPTGEIAKMRKLGITDYAILTYIARVQEGQHRDHALGALLQGRALSPQQRSFIVDTLNRLFPD